MARKRRAAHHRPDDKRRRRLVLVFGLFMIFLMVFSAASVINYNPAARDDLEYGEYEFVLEQRANGGSVLVTDIGGKQVEFQNLPTQVTYLDVNPAAVSLLRNAQQVILAAPTDLEQQDAAFVDYARLQLALTMGKTANAMTAPDDRYALPVMNCSHATARVPVVVFSVTNETTGVTTEGACIRFTGEGQEFMRLKDRIIFEYVGIMQDGVIADG